MVSLGDLQRNTSAFKDTLLSLDLILPAKLPSASMQSVLDILDEMRDAKGWHESSGKGRRQMVNAWWRRYKEVQKSANYDLACLESDTRYARAYTATLPHGPMTIGAGHVRAHINPEVYYMGHRYPGGEETLVNWVRKVSVSSANPLPSPLLALTAEGDRTSGKEVSVFAGTQDITTSKNSTLALSAPGTSATFWQEHLGESTLTSLNSLLSRAETLQQSPIFDTLDALLQTDFKNFTASQLPSAANTLALWEHAFGESEADAEETVYLLSSRLDVLETRAKNSARSSLTASHSYLRSLLPSSLD